MRVSAYNTTTANTNSSTKKAEEQVLGKDDFLKLLTTQLRYQDPTNPVQDKEFIAQLAQFSSLEQMQNLNKTMTDLMEAQQKLSALGQATSLLGRTVEIYSEEKGSFIGRVTGIQFSSGWPLLEVDGKLFDFTEVVSIFEGSEKNGQ